MSKRLHVKYPLFLSDFKEISIFSTDFRKSLKYQVFFRNFANSPKKILLNYCPMSCRKIYIYMRFSNYGATNVLDEAGGHKVVQRLLRIYAAQYSRTQRTVTILFSELSFAAKARYCNSSTVGTQKHMQRFRGYLSKQPKSLTFPTASTW
jgi:hypothetical protein